MPKKNDKDNQGTGKGDENKNKRKKKSRKKPKSYDDIKDKAKNSRKKTVKVFLPAVIKNAEYTAGDNADSEPMTEAEISYKDALLAVRLEELAAKGLKDGEIIKALGISRTTFYEKIRNEPYFSYSLRKHRGILLHQVKNALTQNALGFSYFEQQGTAMGDVVTLMKQKLPETKAQEVLLYNMDKTNWQRKPEVAQRKADNISNVGFSIKRRED